MPALDCTSPSETDTPALAAFSALPEWINRKNLSGDGLAFYAHDLDHSLHDALTLSVAVRDAGELAATYKYNIQLHPLPDGRDVPVLSPLVVMWAEGGVRRKPGMDEQIIRHCIESLQGFCKEYLPRCKDVILTTGYLTIERAGQAFFSKLGWEIVIVRKEVTRYSGPHLTEPLPAILRRIDEISLEHRKHPVEVETVCFGFRRL